MEVTDIYGNLRTNAGELGARILEMYPTLLSTMDEVPVDLSKLLRSALPAQAIAIGGLAKHLRSARAARIIAECGAGKTFMALGVAHVLNARTILVMCPSHITKKWVREAIKTIPFAFEVVVCHPKLVETGLDLLAFPTLYFYQTGYLLHSLRQASRRSWR